MIAIDDSGWGSILGGVCIGMYNTETNEIYSRLIPVKHFQGKAFGNKQYLEEAWNIVNKGLEVLFDGKIIQGTQDIQICRGYLLSKIRERLEPARCFFKSIEHVDIKDPLQSALEEKFSITLARYGVPKETKGAHRLTFNRALEWIREDISRVKYVKTGWDSWDKKYKNATLA